MWYKNSNIKMYKSIVIDDLQGYILPHAGTRYTGNILSHTLRFKPSMYFTNIYILYYPANAEENITEFNTKYFHEYYVLWKTLTHICKNVWKLNNIIFKGFNIRNGVLPLKSSNTLYILSVDFSHFLPLKEALHLENCAASAIMHNKLYNYNCLNVVDHIQTLREFKKIMPNSVLQWVGRTRSPGERSVGYLSFLIRKPPIIRKNNEKQPCGIFVTAYDINLTKRECLGEWFHKYTLKLEQDLIDKVIYLAKNTSRLTGGIGKQIPISCYSVTYLYKENTKKFIRGWHGIKKDAFYLPDVFLENTFNNGKWITSNDTHWPKNNIFKLNQTFKKLSLKANKTVKKYSHRYTLYSTKVKYENI
tara:strand:+ start:1231 stop:2313 length:1083 start_codon:yes stop_codon:yes gene_type:complete